MEYLNDLGAISIGADAPSIDSHHEVAVVKEQPAHIVCRERKILNMENLAQVDMIPAHEFWFIGLPLKIKDGSGSPFRGVAFVPKNSLK
jgi:kynurenine formamidase